MVLDVIPVLLDLIPEVLDDVLVIVKIKSVDFDVFLVVVKIIQYFNCFEWILDSF